MYRISYGGKEIFFQLRRKDVKNINLTVKPNLEVSVSANDQVPLDFIKAFVYSKAGWIEKHLNYYKKTRRMAPVKKEYVSGESFRYLGRQYRLRVLQSAQPGVKYFRGWIHLYIDDLADHGRKKALMEGWYDERSRLVFQDSLQRMHGLVKPYGIEVPDLHIRKMKSRWGTCFPAKKQVTLNRGLIKAPRDCIDYVVLHELIHFRHRNHGEDFYRLLNILMPHWKEKKKILDEVIARDL